MIRKNRGDGMHIDIIVVGKIKEKYFKSGIEEYLKRLTRYAKVKIIEVDDEATGENMSALEMNQVLDKEADRILSHIKPDRKLWVLAIEGKLVTSEDIAGKIQEYATYGQSKLAIVIGGSLGLQESLKKKADLSLSFGRITLPHQMIRMVLVEQIYRAFRIIHNEPYHK